MLLETYTHAMKQVFVFMRRSRPFYAEVYKTLYIHPYIKVHKFYLLLIDYA